MECAVENSCVCFHCEKSFRLELFSEVLLCGRCSLESVEHRRNLTLLKPEVETFVRTGAQSFGGTKKVKNETDNDLPKKFVTRDSTLPSKEQIHDALDESWFFHKFETAGEKKLLRSKRSSTGPREKFEKDFALPLSSDVSPDQDYHLVHGVTGQKCIKVTWDAEEFSEQFERSKNDEHVWHKFAFKRNTFCGSTDEYSRPLGIEHSLLNPVYLESFLIRPGGFKVFSPDKSWKKWVDTNQVVNPPFAQLGTIVPELQNWCERNSSFLVMICPYRPLEGWWESPEAAHVPVLKLST